MNEKFEYGEEVMVRDNDALKWEKRRYIDTLEFKDTGLKWYCTHLSNKGPDNHEGRFLKWRHIRKIEKQEPELIDIEQPETIEQRMDKFEAILNGAIKQINEQVKSIKKQLK